MISGRPSVRLFGAIQIVDGARVLGPRDLGGARPKQVLEILLAARGRLVPADRLADLLWPDDPPGNTAGSVQTFVSVLRRHLTPDRHRARHLLVTESEAYRVPSGAIDLDVDRFDELLRRASSESVGLAPALLGEALALVDGDILEDEPYAAWAQDMRAVYRPRVASAHLAAAEAALAQRDFTKALAHSQTASVIDAFEERAHRIAMLALYAGGQHAQALARYRAFRELLADELGLRPTSALRELETAILNQVEPNHLLPRELGDLPPPRTRSAILGRAAELQRLTDSVQRGINADLVLVHLEGGVGLGKSRLLDELASRLKNAVTLGRSRCSRLEQRLPYVPLAAALRDALPSSVLVAPAFKALAGIMPELGGENPALGTGTMQTLEAVVALLRTHAPVVLVIDDIHWADEHTVAALAYLQRRGTEAQCAIVTAAPAPQDSVNPPASRLLRPDVIVRLDPLTADELRPVAMHNLHEMTGGNPRFVAEATASGSLTTSGPVAEEVLAQCREYGQAAFRYLTAASILPQPFDPEAVAEVLNADLGQVAEELDRLCALGVLHVSAHSLEFRYQFVKKVLQKAVSPARRRVIRLRLAQQPPELRQTRLVPVPHQRSG